MLYKISMTGRKAKESQVTYMDLIFNNVSELEQIFINSRDNSGNYLIPEIQQQ